MSRRILTMTSFVGVLGWHTLGLCYAQTELVLTPEKLLQKSLRTESGAFAGDVRALVLDPDQGSVRLVVIDLGGAAHRTVAIPWSSLTVRRDGSFWLAVPHDELLRAPSYPTLPAAPRERVLPETVVSGTTFVPTDAVRFDPNRVASYRGVVVGTMTAPLQGGVDVVAAIIDVGTEEIRAQLGPQEFLDQIGLVMEPGQSVAVEGSLSEANGRKVVVVSRVSIAGRDFSLRSADGWPWWK